MISHLVKIWVCCSEKRCRCNVYVKKDACETVRNSQQALQKNHAQNSSAQHINHPPVFTTKPGLASQHIDAWEMLTSCWDQCSGLLWSISRLCGLYRVTLAVLVGERSVHFHVQGVFNTPRQQTQYGTVSTHTRATAASPPCTGISSLCSNRLKEMSGIH